MDAFQRIDSRGSVKSNGKKKSQKNIKNLNFTYCMILIFTFTVHCTFFKKGVVTAAMVSVGCVTRPILPLGCPVSRADSTGLRDMRQGHAESIFSNTYSQTF